MGLKIILDAVKSSGGIPKSSGSSGSAPQYDDSTKWGNSTWSTWYGWDTKLAVINYDDANIRIVKQKCTGETDRYALLVNQYLVFCDTDVNVDVVGV